MKAILFDLFGTVVHFKPQVPTIEASGHRQHPTMTWLRETVQRQLPQVAFEDLIAALRTVTQEMTRNRAPEYREYPSRERFQRALAHLDVDNDRAGDLAEELATAHMAHLASQVVLPAGHRSILETLRKRHRVALVSNFDHAETARQILAKHEIADCFDAIVISEEIGRRKPHPAIFRAALAAVACDPHEALFVGDSIGDDVVGARSAGLPVVWVNLKMEEIPAGAPIPDFTISELSKILDLAVVA